MIFQTEAFYLILWGYSQKATLFSKILQLHTHKAKALYIEEHKSAPVKYCHLSIWATVSPETQFQILMCNEHSHWTCWWAPSLPVVSQEQNNCNKEPGEMVPENVFSFGSSGSRTWEAPGWCPAAILSLLHLFLWGTELVTISAMKDTMHWFIPN